MLGQRECNSTYHTLVFINLSFQDLEAIDIQLTCPFDFVVSNKPICIVLSLQSKFRWKINTTCPHFTLVFNCPPHSSMHIFYDANSIYCIVVTYIIPSSMFTMFAYYKYSWYSFCYDILYSYWWMHSCFIFGTNLLSPMPLQSS